MSPFILEQIYEGILFSLFTPLLGVLGVVVLQEIAAGVRIILSGALIGHSAGGVLDTGRRGVSLSRALNVSLSVALCVALRVAS